MVVHDPELMRGTITYIKRNESGERQVFDVGFDRTSLRVRDYDLNKGEEVRFTLVRQNHRDIAVEIIPLSLDELLRKDMERQIRERIHKLTIKAELERKQKLKS